MKPELSDVTDKLIFTDNQGQKWIKYESHKALIDRFEYVIQRHKKQYKNLQRKLSECQK